MLQSERLLAHDNDDPSYNLGGCDAHFFAIALASALYWLGKTDQNSVSYATEIRSFLSELAPAKDLRDMLEHDGDYIIGRGRKQIDYRIDTHVNSGSLHITGLAPFTLLKSDEGLSLGGRISVQRAHDLSKSLLQQLNPAPAVQN